MRFRFLSVLAALVAVAAVVSVAVAGAAATSRTPIATGGSTAVPSRGNLVDESPQAWLVELKGSAAEFRADAKKVGLRYTERFAFTRLFNGVSVSVSPDQLGKLRGMAIVNQIYPVNVYTVGPESSPSPDLGTAVVMTGADIARNELGYTGAGVKVAVMDTGIDVDHPDLGGDGTANGGPFPNSRVTHGFDLVGDSYNADPTDPAFQPVPHPDPNPDDCNGHGTHVAGIVGADGDVTGVAPSVTFGAYRVFGCGGSTTDDVMIAAMERALADGMHVLNMSIGDAFNSWPGSPTAAASSALVDAGMVVVASIGNSGTGGLYAAGAPGVGTKVIGVASFDNSHTLLPYFTVNGVKVGYATMAFSADPPTSGTEETVFVGRGCAVENPSTVGGPPVPPGGDPYLANPSGKVALIERGKCSFAEKATRAIAAGATAVVIHNNAAGIVLGTLGAPLGSDVPVVGISLADGTFIRAQTSPVMMTWTDQQDSFVSPTGGLLSSFTSYGVAADLSLKPDIGAPGGNINSTIPLEDGGHGLNSGTSMSSPHVAGAAALLRQARPTLAASEFRNVLQNSADPKLWSAAPIPGLVDYVFRQGAGMLDVDDAILSRTTVTPSKISLGEGLGGMTMLTLRNSGAQAVTYTPSYVESLAAGPPGTLPFTFSTFAGTPFFPDPISTASFSSSSVMVPAGGSATVNATIALDPTMPQQSLYGGWITFTPQDSPAAPYNQVYRVPVVGFAGDYQSIVAMPTIDLGGGFALPAITNSDLSVFLPAAEGGTWGLTGPDDIPNVAIQFWHQVQRLQMQVVNASNGRPVHPVFSTFLDQRMLSRNSDLNSVFLFPWDGTRMQDNGKGTPDHRKVVPDGQYKIVVKALKALGTPGNAAHWETYTSPTITIDRP